MSQLKNLDEDERCENIRWKGLLIETVLDPTVPHSRDRMFWCHKTQNATGPDGKQVDEYECHPGRGCYVEL
jgi:hypothetical protein